MTSITSKSLTLPEFLSLIDPDGDITYELVDGEAIPKMSPKRFHSRLTLVLSSLLSDWNQGRGEVGVEWAIVLTKNNRDWCPVPDLLYISYQRLGDIPLTDDPCPVPPELVIEIISPEQSFSSLSEKAVDYLNGGVSRVWIVDSRAKQITIFYPDAPPAIKKADDEITDILLADLTLTPRQIFARAGLN
jgi:Uma2 family endonuclease